MFIRVQGHAYHSPLAPAGQHHFCQLHCPFPAHHVGCEAGPGPRPAAWKRPQDV